MPTNTWPLDTPMLPPLVLRPPHGPRLVRLLVLILAVIFYVPPAGWGPITNGPEGELAGAALDLLHRGGCGGAACGAALLHGPLALWLTRSSFAFFGVSEFAARLPAALGAVAALWLTLRLAERLGTLWTGFTAAMLLLCSPGMLSLGRVLTPAPLIAALGVACVSCLQRGAQDRPERRRWLLLAWIAWGFTTLAGGWRAGAVPGGMVLLLALFYPEARLRFRGLLSWEGVCAVALTGAAMTAAGFPPGSYFSSGGINGPALATPLLAGGLPLSLVASPAACPGRAAGAGARPATPGMERGAATGVAGGWCRPRGYRFDALFRPPVLARVRHLGGCAAPDDAPERVP